MFDLLKRLTGQKKNIPPEAPAPDVPDMPAEAGAQQGRQLAVMPDKNAAAAPAQPTMQDERTVDAACTFCENAVAVITGEKDAEAAVADIRDGASSGAGCAPGSFDGLASQLDEDSPFIRSLMGSGVPKEVVTRISVTGKTLVKWANGEIDDRECLKTIGLLGFNMLTLGHSLSLGQTFIPIPVIGALLGALVGQTISAGIYKDLVVKMDRKQAEHAHRERLIEEYRRAIQQEELYRARLGAIVDRYFSEYRGCFDAALASIGQAFKDGDADGVIRGANRITSKLGGNVGYDSVDGFKAFLDNGASDEF